MLCDELACEVARAIVALFPGLVSVEVGQEGREPFARVRMAEKAADGEVRSLANEFSEHYAATLRESTRDAGRRIAHEMLSTMAEELRAAKKNASGK